MTSYSAETEGTFPEAMFFDESTTSLLHHRMLQHVSFEKAYVVGSIRFAHHHWFSRVCGIDERCDSSLTESEFEIIEAAEEAFGLFPDIEATVSYSIPELWM